MQNGADIALLLKQTRRAPNANNNANDHDDDNDDNDDDDDSDFLRQYRVKRMQELQAAQAAPTFGACAMIDVAGYYDLLQDRRSYVTVLHIGDEVNKEREKIDIDVLCGCSNDAGRMIILSHLRHRC